MLEERNFQNVPKEKQILSENYHKLGKLNLIYLAILQKENFFHQLGDQIQKQMSLEIYANSASIYIIVGRKLI